MVTRRDLVRMGTLACAAALAPAALLEAAASVLDRGEEARIASVLSRGSFLAQLDTQFLVVDSDVRLRLHAVVDHPSAERTLNVGSETAFSARFRASAKAELPQGLYTLRHDVLGDVPLLLVPMAPKGNEATYEAVINRSR